MPTKKNNPTPTPETDPKAIPKTEEPEKSWFKYYSPFLANAGRVSVFDTLDDLKRSEVLYREELARREAEARRLKEEALSKEAKFQEEKKAALDYIHGNEEAIADLESQRAKMLEEIAILQEGIRKKKSEFIAHTYVPACREKSGPEVRKGFTSEEIDTLGLGIFDRAARFNQTTPIDLIDFFLGR